MPACPRSEVVRYGKVGVYHVWSRCVRRAFLCGTDPLTGKDHNHRRQWIHEFEKQLAGLYGLEIGFHVEMSNHLHLVVRSRPDVVATWTDQEVVRRALTIYRLVKSKDGRTIRAVHANEIALELADPQRVPELRRRLSDVSCFMQSVCEYVARRANREDECRGAFFEERFKARFLADESAILVCGIYVDLNQIRAGEAVTPEESYHTSAYERIVACQARAADTSPPSRGHAATDGWLCELTLQEGPSVDVQQLCCTMSPRRASEKGLLPIRLDEYLKLLDWTGRAIRAEKKGTIPDHLAPILQRLGINTAVWIDLVTRFDELFSHVVGHVERVAARAAQAGRRWYRGQARCAVAFG